MSGRYKNSVLARSILVISVLSLIAFFAAAGQTNADTLTSPNYTLSPAVGDSFGGGFGSSDYKLTGSGGEAAIGNGTGGSYKLGAGFVAELQHSINLYVEPAGLVGYWPMNEGAGPTVHDASANSNDGTTSGSPTWTIGQIGGALNFAGNGVANFNHQDFTQQLPFTVSAWFNVSSSLSGSLVSQYGNGSWNGFKLFIYNGSLCAFYLTRGTTFTNYAAIASNAGVGSVSCPTFSLSSWHYVVVTVDNSYGMKMYVDGSLAAKSSWVGSSTTSNETTPMVFGESGAYTGGLDDVKIFNRELSIDEVEANYDAGLKGFNSGLVIPPLQGGQSQTVDADVIVDADAPYSLLTRETSPLTDVNNSSNTIPSISGTIASPQAWTDGTTNGLGFSILSAPGGVPAKWGSGTKYAAIPSNATSFFTRSGLSGGAKDVIGLQYRLGVSGAQLSGQYKNNIVYTATMTP